MPRFKQQSESENTPSSEVVGAVKVSIADPKFPIPQRMLINLSQVAGNITYDYFRTIEAVAKEVGIKNLPTKLDRGDPIDMTRFLRIAATHKSKFAFTENTLSESITNIIQRLNSIDNSLIPLTTKEPSETLRQIEVNNIETLANLTEAEIFTTHEDTLSAGMQAKVNLSIMQGNGFDEIRINNEKEARYFEEKARNFEDRMINQVKSEALERSRQAPENTDKIGKEASAIIRRLGKQKKKNQKLSNN